MALLDPLLTERRGARPSPSRPLLHYAGRGKVTGCEKGASRR
jgi:hypothetical protein